MKKEDNQLEQLQASTRIIESKLETEKAKLKNYNEIQDHIESLVKRLNNCYELFRYSMSGPAVDDELDDLENANEIFHKNARNYLERELTSLSNNIEHYTSEKENLQMKVQKLSEKNNNSKQE